MLSYLQVYKIKLTCHQFTEEVVALTHFTTFRNSKGKEQNRIQRRTLDNSAAPNETRFNSVTLFPITLRTVIKTQNRDTI